MHITKSVLLLACGVIIGIALVISCGDDLTGKVDAAVDVPKLDAAPVCDCPAAEPPLAGRFVVVSQTQIIAGNDTGGQGAVCPTGAQLISGSCTTDLINPVRNVTLQQSGFFDNGAGGWACLFRNNEATPVTIRASIICLKPMP